MTEPELTDDEKRHLRRILDQDDKMQWLWTNGRKAAAWVFGVAAALVAFRDDLRELMAWIFERGGE